MAEEAGHSGMDKVAVAPGTDTENKYAGIVGKLLDRREESGLKFCYSVTGLDKNPRAAVILRSPVEHPDGSVYVIVTGQGVRRLVGSVGTTMEKFLSEADDPEGKFSEVETTDGQPIPRRLRWNSINFWKPRQRESRTVLIKPLPYDLDGDVALATAINYSKNAAQEAKAAEPDSDKEIARTEAEVDDLLKDI